MRWIYRFAFSALLLLVPARVALAHHPAVGFGGDTAGPITTISAEPLRKNQWAVGLRTDFLKFDTFSDAQLLQFAAEGKEVHSMEDQRGYFLSAAYGVTGDLTLGLHVPYLVRRGIREGHMDNAGMTEVHVHGDSEGMGDLSLVGQYRIFRGKESGVDVSALFGLKVPSGATRETDNAGERFAAEFQPGSGSWDPLVGAAVTRRWDSLSLDGSVLYTVATKGTQDTDLGDMLHYSAALSWRWVPAHAGGHDAKASRAGASEARHSHFAWDIVLEAAGEWKRKQTVAGVRDDNSGGTVLLVSPGVRLGVHDLFSVYFSAGIPVVQDLNGTQHETRYRLILGISAGL